jgi:hypothetical protein
MEQWNDGTMERWNLEVYSARAQERRTMSPCLLVSLSPCLLVSLSPYANSGFDLTKTGHAGTLLVAETTKGAPE